MINMDAEIKVKRSLCEVQNLLQLAKLAPDAFEQPAQVLCFAPVSKNQLEADDLILIEMDEDLLKESLSSASGLRVTSGTNMNCPAVLCTSDATYDLREAETSNSLLLIPEGQWPQMDELKEQIEPLGETPNHREIVAVKYSYLEARRGRARLEQLDEYLQSVVYKDCNDEKMDCALKFDQLVEAIAGSEKEVRVALERHGTLLINGRVRLLDWQLEARCLAAVLDFCAMECKSPFDSLELESICSILAQQENLLPAAVECALLKHGRRLDHRLVVLEETKLVRHTARVLLSGASCLALSDFLTLWRQALAFGVTLPKEKDAALALLRGMVLIESGTPDTIRLFLEENLPRDACARLDVLFSERAKWYLDELQCYLERVVGAGTAAISVGALLTKHARSSPAPEAGVRLYSRK